ncbi:MAG TPA: MFS transporter [Phycisphaerales bacterium]|nr:MFS transporter [Phycisphaerales bacterium]
MISTATKPTPPAAPSDQVATAAIAVAPAAMPARWVVPTHIAAVTLIQSTWMAIGFITPILARKRFDAGYWETLLVTATPTIFFSLSIFWNDLFRRRPLSPYLRWYWVWAGLPLAFVALAQNYWMLLIPHLVSCIGGAGYHPAAGELLRSLYPERIRGRVFSLIWGVSMVMGAGVGFIVGKSMDHNENAFRIIYPAASLLQLAGVFTFLRLAHATGHASARQVDTSEDLRSRWRRVVEPIGHMREVLAADPIFARYEAGYMTYGVGWMICYALLPIIVTEKLNLSYESIAESTHVAYWLALTAMVVPAGLLMDHIGAVRCTGLSFLYLTLYPIGLIVSINQHELLLTSIVYGIAHSGAQVGWTLGPVSLAPSPNKVGQYVAIHSTLVGIRGKVFQFLGVLLYSLTHSFKPPLIIAALAFSWGAVQMWQLHLRMKSPKPTTNAVPPAA